MAKAARKKLRKSTQTPDNPYKDEEFEAFLESLEDPTVQAHWYQIAEVIGVTKETLSRWQKHPRAIEARQRGIAESLKGMRTAGATEWKMYESKLKMLGIVPVERQEHTGKDGNELIIALTEIKKKYLD